MEEYGKTAFDELEAVLRSNQYRHERIVVLPDELWERLRRGSIDPFPPGRGDKRKVLWYRNWTMVVPRSSVLNCVDSEVKPDGT